VSDEIPRKLDELLAYVSKHMGTGEYARIALGAPATPAAPWAPTPPADTSERVTGPVHHPTIPETMRWASLEAPELRERVARPQAIDEARAALSSGGLLFIGPSGSGKTSLACALLREWEARHAPRCAMFVNAWTLSTARVDHGFAHGEPPEVHRAKNASLLLIDDLGSEPRTTMNAVPEVIFHRSERGGPTWVTTWLSSEALAERYGDGTARRLFEAGRVTIVACGKPK
jgi:hypothetical protein